MTNCETSSPPPGIVFSPTPRGCAKRAAGNGMRVKVRDDNDRGSEGGQRPLIRRVRNYNQVRTRSSCPLLQLFPLPIPDHYSFRPDLGHLRSVDLLLYLPGLELGFPALATSF